jgi:hypothetical protein
MRILAALSLSLALVLSFAAIVFADDGGAGGFEYVMAGRYPGVLPARTGAAGFEYTAAGAIPPSLPVPAAPAQATGHAPIAVSDAYSTTENVPLTVPAPGVLANDVDADHPSLTAVLDSGPATLILNEEGSFMFTPPSDFTGTVTFTYHAFDGIALSTPVAVTITVEAEDAPPIARGESYQMFADAMLSRFAPGVLDNDTDADGDPLTAVLDTPPFTGTLALNPDGSFVYTPPLGFTGVVSFTYHATDGSDDSEPAPVTIRVTQVTTAVDEIDFEDVPEPPRRSPIVAVGRVLAAGSVVAAGLLLGGVAARGIGQALARWRRPG